MLNISHSVVSVPLSMEFYRQECWSGLSFSSPGDLPDTGIKAGSPALQADSLLSEPPEKPQKYFSTLNFPLSIALAALRQILICCVFIFIQDTS